MVQLNQNSFAQCALDLAAHDLWGKIQQQPVYQLWGLETNSIPISNYTIGIDDIDVMVSKLRSKLGSQFVRTVRGEGYSLGVDAEAIDKLDEPACSTAEVRSIPRASLRPAF